MEVLVKQPRRTTRILRQTLATMALGGVLSGCALFGLPNVYENTYSYQGETFVIEWTTNGPTSTVVSLFQVVDGRRVLIGGTTVASDAGPPATKVERRVNEIVAGGQRVQRTVRKAPRGTGIDGGGD